MIQANEQYNAIHTDNSNKSVKKSIPQIKNTAERKIVINGTHIRIKSVFDNKITLEKALTNIAKRKLAIYTENNKI